MGIRRVSDPTTSVKNIYQHGRTYGGQKPHDPDYPKLKNNSGLGAIDPKQQQVQDPQDRCASTGDVRKGWLRGMGSTNQMNPNFDPGGSGRRYDRQSKKD
jgi:hypothetical protein